jgi:thymidylate synthase
VKEYLDMLRYTLENGVKTHNRTGIDTIATSGYMFKHDMSKGFPALTTKKIGMKTCCAELEMFIKGIHNKEFLRERNCHIWDSWCSTAIVPYANDEETKKKMAAENELGPIYGFQYRHFNGDWRKDEGGVDQLKNVIETIKKDPTSRRLVVSAWNPQQLDEMALPPCHMIYELLVYPEQNRIDLMWFQRSSDLFAGVPFDIASYAMLLTLIAKETGYNPGTLIGYFGSCHIYENQLDAVKEQLQRTPKELPTIEITNWNGIWNWKNTDFELKNYNPDPSIKAPIAV